MGQKLLIHADTIIAENETEMTVTGRRQWQLCDFEPEPAAVGGKFYGITEDIGKDLVKTYCIAQQIFIADVMCIDLQLVPVFL